DGIGIFAAQIHIQDGAVQRRLSGEVEPFLHRPRRSYDLAAEFRQPVLDQHGDQRFIVQEQDTRQELLSSKGLLAPAIKAILSWPCKNRGRMTIVRKRTRQPSCRGESRRPNVRCGQRGPSFWSV